MVLGNRRRLRRVLTAVALVTLSLSGLTLVSTSGCASFGAVPTAHFQNVEPTSVMREGQNSALLEWFSSDTMREPNCPLPLEKPSLERPPASGLRITWLGHSTTLIELDGTVILTDPMWSDRASPSEWVGPHRFHPPPLPLDALPKIDAVVISHDHYDHLDMKTVQALAERGVTFHVALGVAAHLRGWGVLEAQIVEHDWWSRTTLPNGFEIVSTPARHFSGRRGIGNDGTLWSSWALIGPKHRVFFSGDTGMTNAFSAIAQRLGPFDVALLEIGQHHPSWGDIHLGPVGALNAFETLGAKRLLPIHWGTFNLALHAWSEPAETLAVEAQRRGLQIVTPRLGESIEPLDAVTQPWWRALPPIAARCP